MCHILRISRISDFEEIIHTTLFLRLQLRRDVEFQFHICNVDRRLKVTTNGSQVNAIEELVSFLA